MARAATQNDNIRLAVVVILLTVLALSLGDALIKTTSAGLVLWQIFVLRSMLAIPILVAIVRVRYVSTPLLPRALGWTVVRSLMLIHAATATFELRASEIADPRPGDRLTLDGEGFVIQGEPVRRDPDRLVWSVDVRSA